MSNKYDSKETEALWEISMNGFQDAEIGDAETTGWYALLKGPFEDPILKGYAGGIIETGSQGFVNGQLFKSKAALDIKWNKISRAVEKDMEGLDEEWGR